MTVEYQYTDEMVFAKFPQFEVGSVYLVIENNDDNFIFQKLDRLEIVDTRKITLCNGIVIDFSLYTISDRYGRRIETSSKTMWAILRCLARFSVNGRIVKNSVILKEVWGIENEESPQLIRIYISRLRKLLGSECIETVAGIGYRFAESNDS